MRITKAKFFNKAEEVQFGNINIFVGPNGTGKTTLLREVFQKSIGVGFDFRWIESVDIDEINQTDAGIIKNFLMEESGGVWNINLVRDDDGRIRNGDTKHCPNTVKDALFAIERSNASPEQIQQVRESFLIRKNFIGFETTDERLSVADEVDVGDALRPTDQYNWIDNTPDLKREIDRRFYDLFGHHFSILSHRRKTMHLGVSKELCPNSFEMSAQEMERWRRYNLVPIKRSGDGMRATIKLFFSLYDAILEVVFIDEPEVFIHPAQRKKIAGEIKRLSVEKNKQAFLVTHDSTTLSGLVDRINAGENIKVFYLKSQGTIIEAPFTRGGSDVTPATKQAKYLESLFHKATIFLEGPDDRFLYEETMSSIYHEETSIQDILFVDTAGADRAYEVARLVYETQVNAVFVFDLDVLRKTEKLQRVIKTYKALGGSVDLEYTPEEEKIKALKKVGIFVAPVEKLENWVEKDDEFPYSAAAALLKDPSKNGFDQFTQEIIRYLGERLDE